MARPRVFISSTYYDLKHLRSALDIFVESLGYDSILSEKGDIAYNPEIPLDESCYREVETADIFVLLIGGAYGSEATGQKKEKPGREFFERYESITKQEYESALRNNTPTYIMVEASVYSEYRTYLKNRDNKTINYAHVNSVNIFRFIEEILARPLNNPTHAFERFADIESWLREQWAGLFRDLLNRRSQQQQLAALSSQISDLKETNNTLRKYLEAVMSGISPAASSKLIEAEKERLAAAELREQIQKNSWYDWIRATTNASYDNIVETVSKSKSIRQYIEIMRRLYPNTGALSVLDSFLRADGVGRGDFDRLRKLLGLKPFKDELPSTEAEEETDAPA